VVVKAKRSYDSARRRRQAEETREVVVEAARKMFLTRGYAATTIAAVADEAGVSVETIYKAFGTKASLVHAIRDRALLGEGPVAAEERSDRLHEEETDPRRVIAGWGQLAGEVAPRVAPVLLLVRAAAAVDTTLAPLHEEMDDDRLRRMTANAKRLRDGGHLAPGLTLERARDVLFTYSSPELYEVLVVVRGWSVEDYGRFVGEALTAALLPPG
jgi:AcrR family transcriptional regulator